MVSALAMTEEASVGLGTTGMGSMVTSDATLDAADATPSEACEMTAVAD